MDNYIQELLNKYTIYSNEYQTRIILESNLRNIIKMIEDRYELKNLNENISIVNDLQKDI
jgi:hypothetical protein